MSALRRESGFTLIEVLVVSALMTVVFLTSIATLDAFTRQSSINDRVNESQDEARRMLDRAAKEMRNLASPTPEQPQAVDKADAYDFVFQSVDPAGPNAGQNSANVRHVRYCLDAADPDNGRIYRQTQTWTTAAAPPAPSTAACPDAAWPTQEIVAEHVVNRSGAQDRPLWRFNSTTLTAITSIRAEVFVDVNPGDLPAETRLSTGLFLRNQNRAPVAEFAWTVAGNRHLLLNGSASEDPEGQTLTYVWYDGEDKIGEGVTCDCVATATGSRSIKLKVFDPAGLEGVSPIQVVPVT